MMTKRKLLDKQINNIQKLLKEGHKPKDLRIILSKDEDADF